MENIIIDKELKELLPPLDKMTYKALEENIIENGCMFPLVTWEGILVDGHNRYVICTKNEIPFRTVKKEFASREDVIIWIISNQVARRNLTSMQLTYFRGLHYNTVKLKRGNKSGRNQFSEEKSENPTFPQEPVTALEISEQYKVSRDTIFADAKATKAIDDIGSVSPEAKVKILSGDVAIDKKELQRLAAAPDVEINEVAEKIANGIYEKKKLDAQKQSDGGSVPGVHEDADTYKADTFADKDGPSGHSGTQNVNTFVSSEAERACRAFLNVAASSTETKLKEALRALINSLEDLYARV